NLLNSSGEQGKEFIQSLMGAYKLKKSEEMQPIASQDLKDLQLHLGRVQDIYYNLSKRIDTRLKAKDAELEETLMKKNTDLETATARIAELGAELKQTTDILEGGNRVIDSQSKKITELEETSVTTKALVAEYKDKNDTMTGLLAEYKSYKAEIEEVKNTLSSEKDLRTHAEKERQDAIELLERLKVQHIEDTDRISAKYDDAIKRLNVTALEDINRLTSKTEEDINRLNSQHKDELQRAKDTLALEQKQTLLDVQVKHQDEINKLHQGYNEQIQEIVISFSHGKNEV
ncbi:MAG: hypothetical protein H7Y18_03075, partial [Clostridiaceae bacterium]|nr:hypothetical protein [Clostridiaceae bacterium]